MSNPFQPQESPAAANTPATPSSSPFGGNDGGMGDGFDLPPIPVGVLRGHIMGARQTKKGIAVDVKCDDPSYSNADKVGIWIGNDIQLLMKLATSLGIAVETRGGRAFFRDSEGHTGLDAFKNKPGHFIFAPYEKDGVSTPSIGKFGLPKPDSSPEWAQYLEEANFSEAQLDALKSSRGGVVPGDLVHLFTT